MSLTLNRKVNLCAPLAVQAQCCSSLSSFITLSPIWAISMQKLELWKRTGIGVLKFWMQQQELQATMLQKDFSSRRPFFS